MKLQDKVLDYRDLQADTYLSDVLTYVDEKITSLLATRLFKDTSYFEQGVEFGVRKFEAGRDALYTEEDFEELSYTGNIERYVMCNYDCLYEKLRAAFSKALGEDITVMPIYSEVLREYSSLHADGQEAYEAFKKDYPNLVFHCLSNSAPENALEEVRTFAAEISRAFPSLHGYIDSMLSYDPENEYCRMDVWLYRSERLGRFLTSKAKGRKAARLRKAVESLSFIKKTVVDGVFYGMEEIGYQFDSYEEYLPVNNLTTHDIANLSIIMELLPQFDEKEVGTDDTCKVS